jgi:hypothetical protein
MRYRRWRVSCITNSVRSLASALTFVLFVLAAQAIHADCVTFLDSDSNPAFSVDTDTHAVTFKDQTAAAFNRFEYLKDNDLLPPDLSFMAGEAAVRYAALGLVPPAAWSARYVREVFRSRDDVLTFMDRHYSSLRPR